MQIFNLLCSVESSKIGQKMQRKCHEDGRRQGTALTNKVVKIVSGGTDSQHLFAFNVDDNPFLAEEFT